MTNFLDKLRKTVTHDWNGHLEIFSLPQAIGNSRQFLLLRTDILYRKQSLGATLPVLANFNHGQPTDSCIFEQIITILRPPINIFRCCLSVFLRKTFSLRVNFMDSFSDLKVMAY